MELRLAFGSLLQIPGEFIAHQDKSATRHKDFVTDLRSPIRALRPVLMSRHAYQHFFVLKVRLDLRIPFRLNLNLTEGVQRV